MLTVLWEIFISITVLLINKLREGGRQKRGRDGENEEELGGRKKNCRRGKRRKK